MGRTEIRQVNFYRAWLPAALWMVIIVSISILPGSNVPSLKVPFADKLVHCGMYFVLSILLLHGLRQQYGFQEVRFASGFTAWAIATLWGTLMEVIQYQFTGTRHFEYLDILANIIGSLLGVGAFIIFLTMKKKRRDG
jgi:VanZ family protein